jgi:hypothetical protein
MRQIDDHMRIRKKKSNMLNSANQQNPNMNKGYRKEQKRLKSTWVKKTTESQYLVNTFNHSSNYKWAKLTNQKT